MNELSQFLVESILGEAGSVDNVVVVYAGRFQPFHKGHYATYQHLVKKFGKNNVFIGTSDKTDNQKSPFNFKEKHLIMTKMFGIPSNRIVNVKNPYAPTEVLNKFDEKTTAFVTVVGEKDSSRLGGKYFEKYKDGIEFEGYKDKGYVYIAPAQSNPISGTDVRIGLRKGSDDDKKNFFVKRAYGKYDDKIFNLIVNKLSTLPEITEEYVWIPKHLVEEWLVENSDLIIEASQTTTSGGDVDDGPNFFFPSYASFNRISKKRALQVGYTVLSQIMSDELTDIDPHPIYPKGPVKAVTPFPAGVIGKITATNQKDYYGTQAYPKWFNHVTRAAALVGYSLVDSVLTKKDKGEALKTRKIPALPLPIVDESIQIPVEIGDTILMGKFKNKKVVVKDIGKDEYGMPTINGKKVATFRMIKEGTQIFFEEDDDKYTHIGYGKYKLKGKEKDPSAPTFTKDDQGKYVKTDTDSDSKEAPKSDAPNMFSKDAGYDAPDIKTKKLTKVQTPVQKAIKKIKLGIQKLAHEEKKYFNKLLKNQNEIKRSFIDTIKDKATGAGKAIKDGLKHEVHIFKEAGNSIKQLATGTSYKDLDPEQQKALKSVGVKILMTGAVAATGGVHAGLAGVSKLAGHTLAELVPHVVGETLLKGIGRAAIFADEDQEIEANLNKYAEALIKGLEELEITPEMMANIIEKNNADTDDSIDEQTLNEFNGVRFDAIGYDKDGNQVDMYLPRARFGFEKNIVHAAADKLFKSGISKGNGIKYIEIYYDKHHLGTIRLPRNFTKGKDWDKLPITEMPMADLVKIDTYADKQLNPVDVVLTDKHFFERLTDPRNDKPISAAELTGFFKRIAKNKKKFLEFLDQYGQVVAKDNRSKINIPFMKQANKVIAKTIMRKDNFMTSNPIYKFEDKIPGGLAKGMDLTDVANKHKVDIDDLMKEFAKGIKVEMEHTNNAKVAEEIALDHLFEDPNYYTKLATIEKKNEYVIYRTHIQKPVDKGGLNDKLNELTRGEIFGGKIKIGGVSVPLEVELLGADNKKKVFVTRVINIDRKYLSKLPSNGILEIPARIFRAPGGGWYKVKTPKAFENLMFGYPDQKWVDDHEKELKRLRGKFNKEKGKDQYYEPALGGGLTEGQILDSESLYIEMGKKKKAKSEKEFLSNIEKYTLLGLSPDMIKIYKNVWKKYHKNVNESLLTEGGAYGHMNHPFDTEINLTFGQLKDIVNRALDGELELTREKTDGQALAISWVGGRLVAARNKGHLANRGANALDAKGVATKFSGRGELEKAYNFAMNDLSKAIGSLSEKQREKIFKNGACFMNLEVIYPTSVNVIPYGQPLLVFHGTMEYNEKGEAIGENQEAAKILAGMIKQVNQNVQSNYTIQGPPVTQLPKSQKLSSLKGKYNSQISKLQSQFKLSDNDGIAEYHQAWWTDFVQKKSPVAVDNNTLMGLVKRWAFYDKSFRLDAKNITDTKVLAWAQKIDKEDHAKIAKNNIRPFEDIFLGVGADVLSFMSSVLTANPDSAVRNMKQRLDQTIKDVEKGGDPKKIAKLKLELERLTAIGGPDKIVPNEGIVFVYGGKTFKLTGTFAPLNQILGLFYE